MIYIEFLQKINLQKLKEEVKSLNNTQIIKKYELRCQIGRSSLMGIGPDGNLFLNGHFISIIVEEIKQRSLTKHLISFDLKQE